jgi:hypothetical protein
LPAPARQSLCDPSRFDAANAMLGVKIRRANRANAALSALFARNNKA